MGKNAQCSICGKTLRKFIEMDSGDKMCPNCGSIARNRRLWNLLTSRFINEKRAILDFSPSRCIYRLLTKLNIQYDSSDISGDFIADKKFDITNIDAANNTYDLIICYHILEHIEDDLKAMNELYRVLKNGGTALIQTPFKDGDVYENDSIRDKKDRLIHFGQQDHVRIYSVSGLKNRLEKCEFNVEILSFPDEDIYHGLERNEIVLVATKF